jgi:hypothetical protein
MAELESLLAELQKSASFSTDITVPMSNEKLKIREMTLKDQMDSIKGLQVYVGDKPEVVYSEMLNHMVTSPPKFNVRDLPEQDITYLLIYNRIETEGPEASMRTQCVGKIKEGKGKDAKERTCGHVNSFTYDLVQKKVLERISDATSGIFPFSVNSGGYDIEVGVLPETSEMKIDDNMEDYIALYYKDKGLKIDNLDKDTIEMVRMILLCAARLLKVTKGDKTWDLGAMELDTKVDVFLKLGGKVSLAVMDKLKDVVLKMAADVVDTVEVECEECKYKNRVVVNMMDKAFFVGRF